MKTLMKKEQAKQVQDKVLEALFRGSLLSKVMEWVRRVREATMRPRIMLKKLERAELRGGEQAIYRTITWNLQKTGLNGVMSSHKKEPYKLAQRHTGETCGNIWPDKTKTEHFALAFLVRNPVLGKNHENTNTKVKHGRGSILLWHFLIAEKQVKVESKMDRVW